MSFAFIQGIGVPELLIVLGIVLVIFGPKRLPGLGRQLGSGMREFKDSLTGKASREDDEDDDSRATARREAIEPTADETEVVTGEARPQDQPASRAERS